MCSLRGFYSSAATKEVIPAYNNNNTITSFLEWLMSSYYYRFFYVCSKIISHFGLSSSMWYYILPSKYSQLLHNAAWKCCNSIQFIHPAAIQNKSHLLTVCREIKQVYYQSNEFQPSSIHFSQLILIWL